jgi:multidrug resistance efflux pump
MAFKRFPQNHYETKRSSHHLALADAAPSAPVSSPPAAADYPLPGAAGNGLGRILVLAAIMSAVAFSGYIAWDSMARYQAHGVVDAEMVRVYSPAEGSIASLKVAPGDRVETNELVAEVINTDTHRDLAKVRDEIRVTQAEIRAKHSEMIWERARNNEIYNKASAELEAARGKVGEYEARLAAAEIEVTRLSNARETGGATGREYDQAVADRASYGAMLQGARRTVIAMEKRLALSARLEDDGRDQIAPYLQRLVYLQNEEARLLDKLAESQIRSPVTGTVSNLHRHAGERVNQDSLFEVIKDGSAKLVLYYESQQNLPETGEVIKVWVPALNRYAITEVVGRSRDTVPAPDQIKTHYGHDEKLVRVFLSPINVDPDQLVVGGVIRKPYNVSLFFDTLLSQQARAAAQ